MSKTEEIGNRVKNLMDLNNITQRELAAKIKISEPAISYLINGKRMPRLETITAIAKALNTDLATLLGNDKKADDNSTIINIPIFRDIKSNDTLDVNNKNVEYTIPAVASRYKNCHNLFGKIINTDEMNPRIMKNDIIIFDTFNFATDQINNGDICLISKGNELAVIREMAIKDNVLCFNLFNVTMPPRMYTIDEMRKHNITIIAKAIKLIHNFREV